MNFLGDALRLIGVAGVLAWTALNVLVGYQILIKGQK